MFYPYEYVKIGKQLSLKKGTVTRVLILLECLVVHTINLKISSMAALCKMIEIICMFVF